MLGRTMPFGIPRIMGWCGTDPPEFRSMVRVVECQRNYFREIHEEWANFDEDGTQVRATASLENMPLVVLSKDPEKPMLPGMPSDVARDFNDAWEPMQEELAHLSSNSSRVIAKGSTHYMQIRPDVVIEAVRTVVDQCRVAQAGSRPWSALPEASLCVAFGLC
jgi:hypothetical protein